MTTSNDSLPAPPRALGVPALAGLRAALAPLGLVALAVSVGVSLRLVGAEGELWLDEVTTLRLVSRATALSDVFLKIHSDNNHTLNSAWIFLIGPDQSAPLLRLPAIVFGGLSLLAARRAAGRYGQAAGLIAALLFATSYFFVHYGSEARGYSAMILASLLAFDALQAWLDRSERGALLVFAAAVCFGTFSHLTMVEATGALCLSAAARILAEDGKLSAQLKRAAIPCVAAAIGSAPALACFAYGFAAGDYRMGWLAPFSFETLAQGLAGLSRTTLGLPEALGDGAVVALTAALALVLLKLAPSRARWFPAIAIFGLPLLHAALGFPTQLYPRFHLIDAVGLLLLASVGLGVLWERRGPSRLLAVAALTLFGLGQAWNLTEFFRNGRGQYTAAIMRIASEGGSYAVPEDSAPFETAKVADVAARRAGVKADFVAEKDLCAEKPQWLVVTALVNLPRDFPSERTAGPPGCEARFMRDRSFPAWGLSGFSWTLYRRAP